MVNSFFYTHSANPNVCHRIFAAKLQAISAIASLETMSPHLKLTYLQTTSVGEITRLILHFGGVPFENLRIDYATMAAIKPTLPLGNVPVLEVNGEVYSQSMAIARYTAKLSGLYPEVPQDALHVDMIVETLLEFKNQVNPVRFDEAMAVINTNKLKILLEETLPRCFSALETRVRGEFFLGAKATYADLLMFNVAEDDLKWCFGEIDLSAYPKLVAIVERVRVSPGIAAYIKARGEVEPFSSFRPKWAAYYGHNQH